jgi:hypothetical protein
MAATVHAATVASVWPFSSSFRHTPPVVMTHPTVWDAGDDGNAESTTQPAHGYRGTPPVCYRPRRSRVHLGNVGLHVLATAAEEPEEFIRR